VCNWCFSEAADNLSIKSDSAIVVTPRFAIGNQLGFFANFLLSDLSANRLKNSEGRGDTMNSDFAHDVLGTRAGDPPETIVEAYHRRHADLEKQIDDAPTPRLKDKRRQTLSEVEKAYNVLLNGELNGAKPPKDGVSSRTTGDLGGKFSGASILPPKKSSNPVTELLAKLPPWSPAAAAG